MCCQLATKQHLRPRGSLCIEIPGTGADHAKTLARGRLQGPPGVDCLDALCTEVFQPFDFSLDVVGLDIEVHATWMAYRLHLDVKAMLMIHELLVDRALPARQGAHRQPQCASPKIRRPVEVQGLTINDEAG